MEALRLSKCANGAQLGLPSSKGFKGPALKGVFKLRQALGSAPEARFSMDGAPGPGDPMRTQPPSARGTQLAIVTSESPSSGCEKLNPNTVFNVRAGWAA